MKKYLKHGLPSAAGALLVVSVFASTALAQTADRSKPTEPQNPQNPSQMPVPKPWVTTNDVPKIIRFFKEHRPGGSGALGRPTFYNEYGPI